MNNFHFMVIKFHMRQMFVYHLDDEDHLHNLGLEDVGIIEA